MEKVKFNIDEDEVRILNQVNYNADSLGRRFEILVDSEFGNITSKHNYLRNTIHKLETPSTWEHHYLHGKIHIEISF